MPRIAIDYTPAAKQGAGIGRYVRELVSALAAIDSQTEYRLFVAGRNPSPLPCLDNQNFSYRTTRLSPRWLTRFWHRLGCPIPVELLVGSIDLFHATDFVLPPTLPSTKTILTVHDLSFVRVPGTANPRLKVFLDKVVPSSACRSTHILADSSATKHDLIELYNLPSNKITVLLSGVDARFYHDITRRAWIRSKYHLPDQPYIFTVGTVQPRKNYERLVRALAQVRAKYSDLCLVIAGGQGWLNQPIYDTIRQLNMQDFVHLTGYVDDNDLPTLYSDAICVAYPSLYEGFGLPILEAMACGTPVVTSNVSSMPEVAGDAAVMVDPYDVEALAYALEQVITDDSLRQLLIHRGYQQASHFTWERAAQGLFTVYRKILSGDIEA